MITNYQKDLTTKALFALIRTAESVQMCGSRSIGLAGPNSDFDFVTENREFFDKMAMDKDWKKSKSAECGYLDENTIDIVESGAVQLILVLSIEARKEAMEYVLTNKLDRNDPESWKEAYSKIKTPLDGPFA